MPILTVFLVVEAEGELALNSESGTIHSVYQLKTIFDYFIGFSNSCIQ